MTELPAIRIARSSRPLASIIICVSSGIDLLLGCLRSLEVSGPKDVAFETIVVLNEQPEKEEMRLRASVSGVEIIASEVNLGLAGGSNLGRESARGEYLVLLHDDAVVQPGWLEALVETAASRPDAGAIGGKVLSLEGHLQNAGMFLWRDGSVSKAWIGVPPPPQSFSETMPVDFCGTSSILVRASAWDAVGGPDERFYPAYFVDADLCMALRQLGWITLCEPRSLIRHHAGASTTSRRRTFYLGRNLHLFRSKWETELSGHAAFDPRDPEGSLRLAKDRAARPLRAEQHSPAEPGISSPARNRLDRTRRHRDMDRTLQREFETDLIRALDHAEAGGGTIPVYRLGTRLSFATGGEAQRFLVAGGCYGAEQRGAWMQGTRLRMMFPLDRPWRPGRLQLDLQIMHLLHEQRPSSPVILKLNGKVAAEFTEREQSNRRYRLQFPTDVFRTTECLILEIESRDPLSPAALSLADDVRPLSLGMMSLMFSELEENDETKTDVQPERTNG